jgi:hypothetical protein
MLAVKNELCLLQIERKYIREKSLMLAYRKEERNKKLERSDRLD